MQHPNTRPADGASAADKDFADEARVRNIPHAALPAFKKPPDDAAPPLGERKRYASSAVGFGPAFGWGDAR
ncbi:hypothetical protein ACIO14_00590 [Nocardia fluminea]|uniref:hypothetical protein n=1 Tax=Nocardia fluminea TaxID=134984 RepID=UPI003826034D